METLSEFITHLRGRVVIKAYRNWLKPQAKVLDLGCGNGKLSAQISKHFNLNLTGCDVIKYNNNIKFLLIREGKRLPFKNHEFNSVIMNDVLHHASENIQIFLLKEALRVGKQVLIFETVPNLITYILDYLINKYHNLSMNIPLTFKNQSQWEGLFLKLGLSFKTRIIRRKTFYPFTNCVFRIFQPVKPEKAA